MRQFALAICAILLLVGSVNAVPYRVRNDMTPGTDHKYRLGIPGESWSSASIDTVFCSVLVGALVTNAESLYARGAYHAGDDFLLNTVRDTMHSDLVIQGNLYLNKIATSAVPLAAGLSMGSSGTHWRYGYIDTLMNNIGAQSILPRAPNTYDLGSIAYLWKSLYAVDVIGYKLTTLNGMIAAGDFIKFDIDDDGDGEFSIEYRGAAVMDTGGYAVRDSVKTDKLILNGNFVPSVDATYDLGTSSYRFRFGRFTHLYTDQLNLNYGSIYVNDSPFSVDINGDSDSDFLLFASGTKTRDSADYAVRDTVRARYAMLAKRALIDSLWPTWISSLAVAGNADIDGELWVGAGVGPALITQYSGVTGGRYHGYSIAPALTYAIGNMITHGEYDSIISTSSWAYAPIHNRIGGYRSKIQHANDSLGTPAGRAGVCGSTVDGAYGLAYNSGQDVFSAGGFSSLRGSSQHSRYVMQDTTSAADGGQDSTSLMLYTQQSSLDTMRTIYMPDSTVWRIEATVSAVIDSAEYLDEALIGASWSFKFQALVSRTGTVTVIDTATTDVFENMQNAGIIFDTYPRAYIQTTDKGIKLRAVHGMQSSNAYQRYRWSANVEILETGFYHRQR